MTKVSKIALWIVIAGTTVACNKVSYQAIAPPWEPAYALDRYEKTVQEYETLDQENQPPRDGIVFIGSSSFTLWKNAPDDLAPLPVINRGFGGSTFPEVVHYLDRTVFKYHPKAVVVYCENDLFTNTPKTPEQTRDEYVKMVQKIREKLPKATIYYVSMKPSPSRWNRWEEVKKVNDLIHAFIRGDRRQEYIDITQVMLSDGRPDGSIFLKDSLHMNAEGYKRWTAVMKPILAP